MNAGYSRMVTGYTNAPREAILRGIEQRMHPEVGGVQQVAQHHGTSRIELVLLPTGQVMHGENTIQGMALAELLEEAHRADPDTEVVVRKSHAAKAEALQALVGKVNAAGLQHVSVSPY